MENSNSKAIGKTILLLSSKQMNEEMEKWKCNIPNSLLGMLRNICILLTKYFKNEADVVEVFFYLVFYFYFNYSLFALVQNSLRGSNISCSRVFDVSIFILLIFIFFI
jgi:hypothetical protein